MESEMYARGNSPNSIRRIDCETLSPFEDTELDQFNFYLIKGVFYWSPMPVHACMKKVKILNDFEIFICT